MNPIFLPTANGPGRVVEDLRTLAARQDAKLVYDEKWLQTLLAEHPEILPVRDFASVFEDPVCAGREITTAYGPIDHLFLSRHAYPILVETKLLKNREQHRTVIGQLLQYTSDICTWSVEKLDEEIKRASGRPTAVPGVKSLHDCIRLLAERHGEDMDDFERTFLNDLRRNLEEAKFLLLIVGDGIRESLVQVSEMLNDPAQRVRGFTLGLVELGIYPLEPEKPWPAFIVPTVVERTKERERVTIQIKYEGPRPAVELTKADMNPEVLPMTRPPEMADVQEFLRRAEEKSGVELADTARAFIDELQQAGLEVVLGEANANVKHDDPEGQRYNLIRVDPAGVVRFTETFLTWPLEKALGATAGPLVCAACVRLYVEALAKAGVHVTRTGKGHQFRLAALKDEGARKAVTAALKDVAAEIDRAVQEAGGTK